MFSKPNTPPPSHSNPANQAKRVVKGPVPSIVSADVIVTGTFVSAGDIQIEGIVQGDVRSVGLVIGEKAEVHGEVVAEELIVRGRVVGRIRARKVQLSSTSHVEGDIVHEAFSVEAGAFFEGNCRHSDNPLGDENQQPELERAIERAPVPPPEKEKVNTAAFDKAHTGLAGLAPIPQAG
jgi:cytoskeletal protein CcmA (bactofilin family)